MPTSSLEHLIVRILFRSGVKNGGWVSYTFLQKACFLNFFSILEENCGSDIINGTINCETFVRKWCKNGGWVSYTFLQNPCSLKFSSILEENCGADIKIGTFNCETFVRYWWQNGGWVSYTFLQKPCFFFDIFQHFRRKMWCRHQDWNI